MKKKFIAAALGMILTICIIALPIVGASADTTINPNILKNGNFYTNTTGKVQWTEKGEIFDDWSCTTLNTESFTINWQQNFVEITTPTNATTLPNGIALEQSFSIETTGNYTVSVVPLEISRCLVLGCVITGTNGVTYSQMQQMEWQNNILVTTFNINYTGTFNLTIYFGYSILGSNQITGIKLETGSTSTAPEGMGDGTESEYDQGYNDGYIAGLQSNLSGIFANTKVNSAIALVDQYEVPAQYLSVSYITNGISLLPVWNNISNHLNDQTNKQWTVKLEFNPFKWYDGMIYLNIMPANQSVTIYGQNGETISGTIPENETNYGYTITVEKSTSLIVKSIEITFLNIEECPIITAPQSGMYSQGFNDGYESGYTQGRTDGIGEGYSKGKTEGYNTGYSEGYDKGVADQQSLFGYIAAIGEAPANMIQEMFNFEIMGVNVSTVIFALLTTALVVILLKKFT